MAIEVSSPSGQQGNAPAPSAFASIPYESNYAPATTTAAGDGTRGTHGSAAHAAAAERPSRAQRLSVDAALTRAERAQLVTLESQRERLGSSRGGGAQASRVSP